MDIKVFPIVLILVMWFGVGCTPKVEPTPPEPELDQYPELVAACADWKTGGGSTATGGSLGSVYRITSLEDKDPYNPQIGTLRYAVNQGGARIVLFDVAGTIHLKAPLEIKNGSITILGQSAPGQGICIADYPIIIKNSNHIVLRFIRCRLGNESLNKDASKDYDAMSINDSRNIMVDHCSFSWSVDECVSCYGNENFTMQYCFITESLRNAGHVKGAHGYGGIWGGKNTSFHHNLLAHHDSRNPRFDHDYVTTTNVNPVDFINNVVYDWGGNSAYGGEGSSTTGNQRQYNFINNYFKPGPSTATKVKTQLLNPTTKCDNKESDGSHSGCGPSFGGTIVPGKFYVTGNVMEGSAEVTEDNQKGIKPDESSKLADCISATRFTFTNAYTGEQSAQDTYEAVLTKAGCSLHRDAVDERIVNEVRNGGGRLIDKPADVGGWPELSGETEIVDTDKDGIPDEWETRYGLDPNNGKDASKVTLVTGYSNIEVYLNDLVKHLYSDTKLTY